MVRSLPRGASTTRSGCGTPLVGIAWRRCADADSVHSVSWSPDGTRLAWQPQANEVFALMTAEKAKTLQAAGAKFYPWKPPLSFTSEVSAGEVLHRFVTSFATERSEIEAFRQALNG